MSSTRRALLTAAGLTALAGCLDDGDETPTESKPQPSVSLEEADAADITASDDIALVGPVLAETLTRAVDVLDEEPDPVVVGGRIQTNGTYHGPRPPLEAFGGIELDGRSLAVPAERVPAHGFPHSAEPETPPDDADVIDLTDHPDRVTGPIAAVIETDGRSSIDGWSAAFQLLDDHASTGGGFGELTVYARKNGETYRIQRLAITPTPYPGYAFVLRVETTAEMEVALTKRELDERTTDAVVEAIQTGRTREPSEALVGLAATHTYLLTDRGLYEATVE